MSMVNLTEDLSLKCKVSSQLNKSAEYAAKVFPDLYIPDKIYLILICYRICLIVMQVHVGILGVEILNSFLLTFKKKLYPRNYSSYSKEDLSVYRGMFGNSLPIFCIITLF